MQSNDTGPKKSTDDNRSDQSITESLSQISGLEQADHIEYHVACALKSVEDDDAREHLRRALQRLHPDLEKGEFKR